MNFLEGLRGAPCVPHCATNTVLAMAWSSEDIPDLRGRTMLITGANSGIGLEAVKLLGARGAHVIMACRNLEKGQAAMEHAREAGAEQLELVRLDLADLASVREAATEISERHSKLDVLINNAGVMALPQRKTADGFEMQFGTNHLGHFALTGLLMPLLERGDQPRVVTVSSGMHRIGRMQFDDLQRESNYERWTAYAQSKVANLLFCRELQKRLTAAGSPMLSLACHPGYASTQLQTVGADMSGSGIMKGALQMTNALFSQSAEAGAWPTVFAATSPEVEPAGFYGPRLRIWGKPTRDRMSRRARNDDDAARLWDVSEELTGVRYLSSSLD